MKVSPHIQKAHLIKGKTYSASLGNVFNPFHATTVSLYTNSKDQKIRGFLVFSGDIERDHWDEMG